MKITPLPSVEEEGISLGDYLGCNQTELTNELRKRDDQAYTSLIEGIEGMKINQDFVSIGNMEFTMTSLFADGHDKALKEIIEKVVKPLYNKE